MIKNDYMIKDNLIIRVYTIGFDPQGESILITICDGECVLFAGLIDCFINDNDYIINLLDKLNIKKLNYFCITHPDFDHCVGVSKILDKINCTTKVALPSRIFDFLNGYDLKVKESLESLRNLLNLRSNNKKKPILNTVCNNHTIIDDWNFYDHKGEKYELNIMTITPSANVIEKYALRNNTNEIDVEHNDFSVVNLIKIGGLKLLLTGDTMNNAFKDAFANLSKFGTEFFNSKIDFVKIPHHASPGSNLLLEKIKTNGYGIGISTTTVFRKSKLPNYELFIDYNSCSDYSFCTCTEKTSAEKKGIILYEADITNMKNVVFLFDTAVEFNNYRSS